MTNHSLITIPIQHGPRVNRSGTTIFIGLTVKLVHSSKKKPDINFIIPGIATTLKSGSYDVI